MKFTAFIFIFVLPVFALANPSVDYIQKNAISITAQDSAETLNKILEKYRVIAIDEHHGTHEIPVYVAEFATEAAKKNKIILALEIQQMNQQGIDRYIQTGDESYLRSLPHFSREYQDGRSSHAMAGLLKKVRTNKNILVFAFDPDASESGQERDTKMAQNIAAISRQNPDHKIIVLAGNVHSATKVGNFFDSYYRPMAYELSRVKSTPFKPRQILSVMTRYETASIWACMTDKVEECGVHHLHISPSNYSSAVKDQLYFLLEPEMSEEGYLATFFIRHVRPSPPLVNLK